MTTDNDPYWSADDLARIRTLFSDVQTEGVQRVVDSAEDGSPHLIAYLSMYLADFAYLTPEAAVRAMGGETFDAEQAKKLYEAMRHASDVRMLQRELQQRPQYVEWKRREDLEAMNRSWADYGL